MRYSRQIGQSIQALPPLQAERRLRNRLSVQEAGLLDELLTSGDPGTLKTLRDRLGEYDLMLLARLLESPTAHPPAGEG